MERFKWTEDITAKNDRSLSIIISWRDNGILISAVAIMIRSGLHSGTTEGVRLVLKSRFVVVLFVVSLNCSSFIALSSLLTPCVLHQFAASAHHIFSRILLSTPIIVTCRVLSIMAQQVEEIEQDLSHIHW